MEKEHTPSHAFSDRESSSHVENIRDEQSSRQEDEGMVEGGRKGGER